MEEKKIVKWLKKNQLVIYGTGIAAVLGGFGLYKLYMAGVENGANLFAKNMVIKQVTFRPDDNFKQSLIGLKVLYKDKLVQTFYMDEEDSVATAKEIYDDIVKNTK